MGERAPLTITIVGGGIVGVCCAAELARAGHRVFLLEQRGRLFEESSTHNSGVVHAGIYYEPGSRKARSCVEGLSLTYAFCESHGVAFNQCGKLILAFGDDEVGPLRALIERGRRNGVRALAEISPEEALEREPHIAPPTAAALSPATGVLDVAEYLRAWERQAHAEGAQLLSACQVTRVDLGGRRPVVHSGRGEMECDLVVNAAGLWTDEVEKMAGLECKPIGACRGEYFVVLGEKARLVGSLLYRVPGVGAGGLGVHLTPTLPGELLVGPNASWTGRKADYEEGREGAEAFLDSARHLLPALELADLKEAYAGIRPKLVGPGEGHADFEIVRVGPGGRMISLRGIESPGLTAAPALAREVAALAGQAARDF